MRKLAFLLFISLSLFVLAEHVLAQEPTYDQVNTIAKKLNCPTCAGINLADCRTQTCAQWREQIDDLLREGYSEQEVLDYFTTQYGTQVLQEPPRSGFTLILWVLPIAGLLAAGAWLFYTMRRWSTPKIAPAEADLRVAGPPEVSASQTDTSDNYLKQVEQDLGLDEGRPR